MASETAGDGIGTLEYQELDSLKAQLLQVRIDPNALRQTFRLLTQPSL